MAYGSCDSCGCAHHECECAERSKFEELTRPQREDELLEELDSSSFDFAARD